MQVLDHTVGCDSIDPIELSDSPSKLSRGRGHPSNGWSGPNGSPIWPTLLVGVSRPSSGVQVLPPTSHGHHVGGIHLANRKRAT